MSMKYTYKTYLLLLFCHDFYLQMHRIKQQMHEMASRQTMSTKMPIPQGLCKKETTSHSMKSKRKEIIH